MGKTWLADKARQRRFELERDEGQGRIVLHVMQLRVEVLKAVSLPGKLRGKSKSYKAAIL